MEVERGSVLHNISTDYSKVLLLDVLYTTFCHGASRFGQRMAQRQEH